MRLSRETRRHLAQNNPELLDELTRRSGSGRRLSRRTRRYLARNNPELLAELEPPTDPVLLALVLRFWGRK